MAEGAELEDLEDVLVIWIRQVNMKNGIEADEAIKK
jgi:hypothetical protein